MADAVILVILITHAYKLGTIMSIDYTGSTAGLVLLLCNSKWTDPAISIPAMR